LVEDHSVAPSDPNLLGVDVGFSKTGRSTGLAWRVGRELGACKVGSGWEARRAALPVDVTFDMAALDAPLVPPGPGIPRRSCEAVFYRGAFWNRCRPGMSHHGRGLLLREAGASAASQFRAVVGTGGLPELEAVPGARMVEAFPNTFMGVLLPETAINRLEGNGKPRSDRLYEACLADGAFERFVASLGWPVAETIGRLAATRDHDLRAAYICLLTAAVAHAGTAAVFGDAQGGWFWLPPVHLWAPWALAAVEQTLADTRKRGHPDVAKAKASIGLR
jgi:hypothetical protein